jgi:hypothetical protein
MSSMNVTPDKPSSQLISDVQGDNKHGQANTIGYVAKWAPVVAAIGSIVTIVIMCATAVIAWIKLGPELMSLQASSEKHVVEIEKARVEIERAKAETEKLNIEMTLLRGKAKAETERLSIDVASLAAAEERRKQQEAMAKKQREREAPFRELLAILNHPIGGYQKRHQKVSNKQDLLKQTTSLLAIERLDPDIRAAAKELQEEIGKQPDKVGEPGLIEETAAIRILRMELNNHAIYLALTLARLE